MDKNVLITPSLGKIEFYTGNTLNNIIYSDDNNIYIQSVGSVVIGDSNSDIYVGDGLSNVDIIFEQDGEIRALTGKTLQVGVTGSTVNIIGSTIKINEGNAQNGYILSATGTDGSAKWISMADVSGMVESIRFEKTLSGLGFYFLDNADYTYIINQVKFQTDNGTGTTTLYINTNTVGGLESMSIDDDDFYTFTATSANTVAVDDLIRFRYDAGSQPTVIRGCLKITRT